MTAPQTAPPERVSGDLIAEPRTIEVAGVAWQVLDLAYSDALTMRARITVYSPLQARELAAYLQAWADRQEGRTP